MYNITVNSTFPGSGGGGGGGDPTSIGLFIPEATEAARRMTMAANHELGTGSERGFTGFTAADESAMTVITVSSASQWLTEMVNHANQASEVIIELDWDGESAYTPSGITGPNASTLTPNAAVDYGYNRLGSRILVRPASGRAPIIDAGGSALFIYGPEFMEFRDIEFYRHPIRSFSTGTYPSLGVIAFNGVTFNEMTASDYDGAIVISSPWRTLHMEDCTFRRCRGGIIGSAETTRIWNTTSVDHGDSDFFGDRGYPQDLTSNWMVRTWMSGISVHAASPTLYISSPLHIDFHQITTLTSGANARERERLIEFCYFNPNRPPGGYATQGIAGFDAGGGTTGTYHSIFHNNIIAVGGYHAILLTDLQDAGEKFCGNNTCLRAGWGYGNAQNPSQDSYPWIRGVLLGSNPTHTGYSRVHRNDFSLPAWDAGGFQNVSLQGNRFSDPRLSAHQSGAPEAYRSLFEGNGGGAGFVTNVRSEGYMTWDAGELPTDTKAQALAKIRAFFTPQGGSWIQNAADGPGAVDPDLWPAHPTDIVA